MVNLKDNDGQTIFSSPEYWYKIVLADGSELGIAYHFQGGSWDDPKDLHYIQVFPAGCGMVVRYQRYDGDDRPHQGWPIGEKGYLRCMQLEHAGRDYNTLAMNMSLFSNMLSVSKEGKAFGLRAEQLPNNRVALYGYNKDGKLCGLRVRLNDTRVIDPHLSDYPMALDCEFVKVSTSLSKGNF